MLIFDFYKIGNRLFEIRKRAGMTQSEVAEAADVSDHSYADIERGTVNMRMETLLKICKALRITPDAILTEDNPRLAAKQSEIIEKLNSCTELQRETALKILEVYLDSVKLTDLY